MDFEFNDYGVRKRKHQFIPQGKTFFFLNGEKVKGFPLSNVQRKELANKAGHADRLEFVNEPEGWIFDVAVRKSGEIVTIDIERRG